MRPDETFVGQPVRSLQQMLRTIAESDSRHPSVVPDGIYGPDTVAAVSYFQRRYGLPVTGVTDLATWETIVPVYEDARVDILEADLAETCLSPAHLLPRQTREEPLGRGSFLDQALPGTPERVEQC